MGIFRITTDTTGQVDVNPRRVKIITADDLGTVTAAGYLNQAVLQGYVIYNTDIIDLWYGATIAGATVVDPGTYAIFTPSIVAGVITLVDWANPPIVTLPVVAGNLAKFDNTSGTLADQGIAFKSVAGVANAGGNAAQTFTDAFCTTSSCVVGNWATQANGASVRKITPGNGSFVVTSSADAGAGTFSYIITK